MTSHVDVTRSNFSDVISGEGSEDSRPLRRSDEPAVVALLHDVDDVALLQLHLVVVLRVVVVESAVPWIGIDDEFYIQAISYKIDEIFFAVILILGSHKN